MAFSRSGLPLFWSFSHSLVHGALAAAGILVLLSRVGCIDGTTPNCAGDAGCGPDFDAGPDVGDGKTDGKHDAAPTDAPSDTATDAPATSDALTDAPAQG